MPHSDKKKAPSISKPHSPPSAEDTMKLRMNWRSFTIVLKTKKIQLSGMAHPVYWSKGDISLFKSTMQKLDVTDLLSLETGSLLPAFEFSALENGKETHKHFKIQIEDFHAPTLTQLQEIMNAVETRADSIPNYHLAVHCRGGVGRTGTILATIIMKSLFEQNPSVYMSSHEKSTAVAGFFEKIEVDRLVSEAVLIVRSNDIFETSIETGEQLQSLNLWSKFLKDSYQKSHMSDSKSPAAGD